MKIIKFALLASAAFAFTAAPAVRRASRRPAWRSKRNFDALISSADQMQWLQQMSSEPNHVGSPHDKANAEFQLAHVQAMGLGRAYRAVRRPLPDADLDHAGTDRARACPPRRPGTAGRRGPEHHPRKIAKALPPYVALQGDGDVTAPVVYVNYGMPDDYDALARRGIDVQGKIVLARYG